MRIWIGKYINEITLNPLEFLIDDESKEILEFESKDAAKDYLRSWGITDEDELEDCFVYYNPDTKEHN